MREARHDDHEHEIPWDHNVMGEALETGRARSGRSPGAGRASVPDVVHAIEMQSWGDGLYLAAGRAWGAAAGHRHAEQSSASGPLPEGSQ
jgi:hypothetical protein